MEHLKNWRNQFGANQEQLAKLTGLTRARFSVIETGHRNPNAKERNILSLLNDCAASYPNKRRQEKIHIVTEDATLHSKLRKAQLSLRKVNFRIKEEDRKIEVEYHFFQFLLDLQGEASVAETKEYELSYRETNERLDDLYISIQRLKIQKATLKASIKAIKRYILPTA